MDDAADDAFWTEQQKVTIPGWLREDQKERLHQGGHFASIQQPRSPTTKKNEAKRRIPCSPPQWRHLVRRL